MNLQISGILAVLAVAAAAAFAQPPATINGPGSTLSLAPRQPADSGPPLPYGLQLMARFDLLPRQRDTKCVQDSSYDRSGGNGDAGNFLHKTGNVAVLSDIKGPGCIYRFWSANAAGHLRVYFDGEADPRIDCPMQDLFLGKVAPFVSPIVGHRSGGWYCFFPIPFKTACRIEVTDPGGMYYHVEYQLFPDGTPVTSFTRLLSADDQKALDTIVNQWQHLGDDPGPAPGPGAVRDGHVGLGPGQRRTIATLDGAGQIRSLRIKLAPADRNTLRETVLRVYWDGAAKPAIESPVGDFFGTGFGDQRFTALPTAMTDAGGVCYWPMPYGKSARFEIANEGKSRLGDVTWHVGYETARPMVANEGYFHAQWHRQTTVAGEYFHILNVTGRGHYVGEHTDMQGDRGIGFLEGDEKIYADGETFPSIYGTGTEDFYTGGWYFDQGPFNLAYHGCILKDDGLSRVSAYRYQIQDCVPFRHDLKVDIEHGGGNDYPGADYSCVAYWYQDAPGHDWSPIDPAQLTPAHIKVGGAIEAESLKPKGGPRSIEDDDRFPAEASGGQALALKGDKEENRQTPFTFTVPVPAEDVYRVHFAEVVLPDSPPSLSLLPDVNAVNAAPLVLNRPDPKAARADYVFPMRLAAGSHIFTLFVPPGKTRHLDYIRLEPSQKERGVIEAESLHASAVATGGTLTREEGIDLLTGHSPNLMDRLSGFGMLTWKPAHQGDTLRLPLTAAADGDYDLMFGIASLEAPPALTIALDGGAAFKQLDLSSLPVFTGVADDYHTQAVRAGRLAGLTKGAHTLVITCAGPPAPLRLDYLRLARSRYANSLEAETLRVLEAKDGDAQVQEMRGFGQPWSGDAQFWFLGQKPGAEASLELPVEKSGRYDIGVYYTTAGDYAIVQVLVDGKEVGAPVDCYTTGVLPRAKAPLGTVDLTAGVHRITFRSVGKNAASSNYLIGVDAITLDPAR